MEDALVYIKSKLSSIDLFDILSLCGYNAIEFP
jgi:hypothetical protein